MLEKTIEKYTKIIEERKLMSGIVKLTQFNEELSTDIVLIDLDGVMAIIPREEIGITDIKRSLVNFIGKRIKFYVKEIDVDKNLLICSRKEFKEEERDALIKKLEAGENVKGRITKFVPFGAFLNINGVVALIHNRNFANDYTAISEIKKIGDTIDVKLNKISKNKRILVEAVNKYEIPTAINLDLFKPNQVVFGKIRNITTKGCFVCIAPGLDALCPVPLNLDIEEDMEVSFKIQQVNRETDEAVISGKKIPGVRGKIVRIITKDFE